MSTHSQANQTNGKIKVWDPLIRVFHWSLVISFFTAYITEDDWLSLHTAAGYTVAGLIGFRLIWGIIGTRFARFTQFIYSPKTVIEHLKGMRKCKAPHYLGHNPAAAAMVLALLISLAMTAFTGMSIISTEGNGPLAGTFISHFNAHFLEEVHEFFATLSVFLVVFHVGGVIFSSFLEKENLARSMVNGFKKDRKEAIDYPETSQ